jgi:hypothetical protein
MDDYGYTSTLYIKRYNWKFLLKISNLFITYGIADALKGDKSILITVYLGILFFIDSLLAW